jgi:hypothetical protein
MRRIILGYKLDKNTCFPMKYRCPYMIKKSKYLAEEGPVVDR